MSADGKYKIAVFGSASGDMQAAIPLAVKVGEILGRYADSVVVITGACSGLPYAAAKVAAEKGVEVWGFSSSVDEAAQKLEYPDDDLSIYSKLVYVPEDFPFVASDRASKKYRNVISAASCDAAIIICGRWGTLNEFTNVIDMQKTIGILSGSGGIADELPPLSAKITKAGQGELLFETDPELLVGKLLSSLPTKAKL
ncbi:MAG TPA: hypothetical protein VII55_00295 [Candidatus Saccharimonadales bacterium]